MSDRFLPLSMDQLTGWVFDELEGSGSVFGIPRALFFSPRPEDRFRTVVHGHPLETPFGAAAGPHTQMAQNIVAAWLCGARFIELKTVQELDELEVAKPCIDMQDEGYNVEWSQELRVAESLEEYLRAWVLVHALHRALGFPGERPAVVWNASVGYDLAGIRKPKVRGFLEGLASAGDRVSELVEAVGRRRPDLAGLEVPARVSDSVTVSTMHGCPPGEIGRICRHLMEEHGLHTAVKLNPTLLGPERVREILNGALGFAEVHVPDEAFAHDIAYPEALALLDDLSAAARAAGVELGVKLCNTLEVRNHRRVFASDQATMYMSGRPHHALAVALARRLAEDTGGRVQMSFSGGADAWTVVPLLAAGMKTVTACSDLLRPGGYGRLGQYLEVTASEMERLGARDLDGLSVAAAEEAGEAAAEPAAAALANLRRHEAAVLEDPYFKREAFERSRTKGSRPLGRFDCIAAPCVERCPIGQRVPEYLDLVRRSEPARAAAVIRDDSAMAAVLGRACTHACEEVCVRGHYDEPVAIREVKRFAMEHEEPLGPLASGSASPRASVALVGAGPCSLSVAWMLGRAGYGLTVYEAREEAGGMVSASIPAYRATDRAIAQDLALLGALGLELRPATRVGRDLALSELRAAHDFVVLAAGAEQGLRLGIAGEDAAGVLDGLELLRAVRAGRPPALGSRIGVIGGGDVAVDCARTARRLAPSARVSIVYRRGWAEMPAGREEREGLDEELIPVEELLAPRRVLVEQGRVAGLECARMRLGEPDGSGRRRPVETGETTVVDLDTVIVAVGQRPDLGLLGDEPVALTGRGLIATDPETGETSADGLYAGGDLAEHGPATIVRAAGDGKRIARAIRARVEGLAPAPPPEPEPEVDLPALLASRARRVRRLRPPALAAERRRGFDEVVGTLSDEAARREASRCLRCDLLCSICAGVCPNRAIQTYALAPISVALPSLVLAGGALAAGPSRPFRLGQRHQVLVLADLCNECGNCATFCPTAGRPHADKPRLTLRRAELDEARDGAFMVSREGESWTGLGRFGGRTHRLVLGETLRYEGPAVRAVLRPGSFELLEALPGAEARPGEPIDLEPAAVLAALVEAVGRSLAHLPSAPPDEAGS